MMYTLKEPHRGFYYMDTDTAREASLSQTGFSISDFSEIADKDYEAWCNPPEGYYAVFDEDGPRVEKMPPTDFKALAEMEREALLSEAIQATTVSRTKLMMGRKITDAETASLNAWMDYIDLLNDTDLSDAPDVQWPTKPAT